MQVQLKADALDLQELELQVTVQSGRWVLHLGPLQEQSLLFSTEPSSHFSYHGVSSCLELTCELAVKFLGSPYLRRTSTGSDIYIQGL